MQVRNRDIFIIPQCQTSPSDVKHSRESEHCHRFLPRLTPLPPSSAAKPLGTSSLRAALTIADVLVVPVMQATFDVWSLDQLQELTPEAREINTDLHTHRCA
jgi:hypothetical protein